MVYVATLRLDGMLEIFHRIVLLKQNAINMEHLANKFVFLVFAAPNSGEKTPFVTGYINAMLMFTYILRLYIRIL